MIEINLLPEEMRKKPSPFANIDFSSFDIKKLPFLSIAAWVVGALILLEVVLFGLGVYSRIVLASLTKRYEAAMPKKKEADALKAQNDAINKRVGAIDELTGKRFSWAKKLNALSDSMTPGVWLTDLFYDEQPVPGAQQAKGRPGGMPGRIVMGGYAAGSGEQGAALVGKFIKSLKDNPEFFSDFSDVELVGVKSDKIENQEVVNFRIRCPFK